LEWKIPLPSNSTFARVPSTDVLPATNPNDRFFQHRWRVLRSVLALLFPVGSLFKYGRILYYGERMSQRTKEQNEASEVFLSSNQITMLRCRPKNHRPCASITNQQHPTIDPNFFSDLTAASFALSPHSATSLRVSLFQYFSHCNILH